MAQGPDRPSGLIFVIAGSYPQFEYWCRFIACVSPRSPAIRHVRDAHRLMGMDIRESRGDRVVLYGTYYERPDWPEIQERLVMAWRD